MQPDSVGAELGRPETEMCQQDEQTRSSDPHPPCEQKVARMPSLETENELASIDVEEQKRIMREIWMHSQRGNSKPMPKRRAPDIKHHKGPKQPRLTDKEILPSST